MKAMITGSGGFIGTHLRAELEANGYDIICCDIAAGRGIVLMDIMDPVMVCSVMEKYRPDVLINLAGQANVGLSWKKPQLTVELNTVGMINILEAVRMVDPKIRVIAVGSSDEYGHLEEKGANVTEETEAHPASPYAVSKMAQESFAQMYVHAYGMNVCMVRLFNLGGAGQGRGFMISDFSAGIAEIEAGRQDCLSVGNLESARDFTHVKDACRAFRMIAEQGHAGEVYNICSGRSYKAGEVLDRLLGMSETAIKVRRDPSRMRPSDTPVICGNHGKLTDHTGWMPQLGLDEILRDALNYWREHYKHMESVDIESDET